MLSELDKLQIQMAKQHQRELDNAQIQLFKDSQKELDKALIQAWKSSRRRNYAHYRSAGTGRTTPIEYK